jgi:hypothetical protein
MVAVEKRIPGKDSDTVADECLDCRGSGTVSHSSDVAYFEDRRVCTSCEAGRAVESRITDILRRAQLEQRLLPR